MPAAAELENIEKGSHSDDLSSGSDSEEGDFDIASPEPATK